VQKVKAESMRYSLKSHLFLLQVPFSTLHEEWDLKREDMGNEERTSCLI